MSGWSMYNAQFKGIKKMWQVLKVTKFTAILPWVTFGFNVAIFGKYSQSIQDRVM